MKNVILKYTTTMPHKPIRSFVLRQGRMSEAQKNRIKTSDMLFDTLGAANQSDLESINSSFKHLEIGFGMGDQIAQRCKYYSKENFIGLEVHLPGVASALKKAHDLQLSNLKIIRGDAAVILNLEHFLNFFESIWIMFPDPWPKKNHKKRRLVNQEMLSRLVDCLKKNGQLFIQTDCSDYALEINNLLKNCQKLKSFDSKKLNHQEALLQTKYAKKAKNSSSEIFSFFYEKLDD